MNRYYTYVKNHFYPKLIEQIDKLEIDQNKLDLTDEQGNYQGFESRFFDDLRYDWDYAANTWWRFEELRRLFPLGLFLQTLDSIDFNERRGIQIMSYDLLEAYFSAVKEFVNPIIKKNNDFIPREHYMYWNLVSECCKEFTFFNSELQNFLNNILKDDLDDVLPNHPYRRIISEAFFYENRGIPIPDRSDTGPVFEFTPVEEKDYEPTVAFGVSKSIGGLTFPTDLIWNKITKALAENMFFEGPYYYCIIDQDHLFSNVWGEDHFGFSFDNNFNFSGEGAAKVITGRTIFGKELLSEILLDFPELKG
jgi:hypothetical protein